MNKQLIYAGRTADGSEMDDEAVLTADVVGGPHAGHIITESTAKHNCGAYEVTVTCSCGSRYENAMHGCWQQNHQRSEVLEGQFADELKLMQSLEYQREVAAQ